MKRKQTRATRTGFQIFVMIFSTSMLGIITFYQSEFFHYGKVAMLYFIDYISYAIFGIFALITTVVISLRLFGRFGNKDSISTRH